MLTEKLNNFQPNFLVIDLEPKQKFQCYLEVKVIKLQVARYLHKNPEFAYFQLNNSCIVKEKMKKVITNPERSPKILYIR